MPKLLREWERASDEREPYQPTPGDLVIRQLLVINEACKELLDLMDKLDKKEEGK